MSEKRKREAVTDEMRERLLANRQGRLTTNQWLEIATEPLVTLLILLVPAAIILGPRMVALARFGGLFLLLILLAVVIVPVLVRAQRYARSAVHFSRLYAGVDLRPWWMFWRPHVFYSEDDEPITFAKRLAPSTPLRINGEYLAYYLEDKGGRVLLSLAPSDHPDAETWLPTETFHARFTRRSRSQ